MQLLNFYCTYNACLICECVIEWHTFAFDRWAIILRNSHSGNFNEYVFAWSPCSHYIHFPLWPCCIELTWHEQNASQRNKRRVLWNPLSHAYPRRLNNGPRTFVFSPPAFHQSYFRARFSHLDSALFFGPNPSERGIEKKPANIEMGPRPKNHVVKLDALCRSLVGGDEMTGQRKKVRLSHWGHIISSFQNTSQCLDHSTITTQNTNIISHLI